MRAIVLAAAVALAFADSSIVVPALPELLQRVHTSGSDGAWGGTSYNLAVALLAVGRAHTPRTAETSRLRLAALGAQAALGLVSAALVGALFLAVVLLVNAWGYEPLAAAGIVSALPAATVAGAPLGRRAD